MPVALRWLLRLGPTNPIVVRLVQTGSRRTRHLYIRTIYLGALIAVLLWALLVNARGDELSYQALAQAGSKSFAAIAFLQIALICILAPVFMAGAIAQEADPQTWDILLSTPLGAGEIVLGNLLGRLFFILALLFSSLPLFAVTQYFGGVPGTSIFSSYLIAACAALLVGSTAIALSVSRLVGRRAVFAFYVAVVSYLAVTWAADALLRPGVTWITALNPFLALEALLDPAGYPSAETGKQTGLAAWFLESPATTWCLLSSGVSLALMVVSTITVRVGGIAGLGGLSGRGGGIPWYRRLFGLGAAGAQTRPPRHVWHNPIAWREAAARNATLGRILARWSFIVGGAALATTLIWMYHVDSLNAATFRTMLLYTITGQMAVISLVAINMAATAVSREREDGTLDLLLTTPITPGQYLSGKLKGIVAYLLPMLAAPMLTGAAAGIYCAFGGFGRVDGAEVPMAIAAGVTTKGVPVVLPEAALVLPLVCIPFTAFCVIVGMAMSLRSKGTISSVMTTVGIVAAIGGTVGLCAWNAGSGIAQVGPVLGAMSPASAVFACVEPERAMQATVYSPSGSIGGARVALFAGALVAAVVYVAVVAMLHAQMTRTFDMIVRRLAGTK